LEAPPQTLPKGREFIGSPLPGLPKEQELFLAVFKGIWCGSFPLGKAGMGLLCWLVLTPGNSDGVAIS